MPSEGKFAAGENLHAKPVIEFVDEAPAEEQPSVPDAPAAKPASVTPDTINEWIRQLVRWGTPACAALCGLGDEVHCPGHFRCQGNQQHGVDGADGIHFLNVCRAHERGVLRAALLGVDVRPFQVHAGGLGSVRGGGVFLHARAHVHQRFGAQRQRGGQPRGHAFLHLAVRDGADALHFAVACVAPARTVRVDVDKARQQQVAPGIDDLVGRRGGAVRVHGGYLGAFNQDGGPGQVHSGGYNVRVGDERLHGNLFFRECPVHVPS